MKKSPLMCVLVTLLIVGGLNWGLVGLGMLMGSPLNLVTMLFGTWPVVEAVVYLLVGVAALCKIVLWAMGGHCKGGSCEGGECCK